MKDTLEANVWYEVDGERIEFQHLFPKSTLLGWGRAGLWDWEWTGLAETALGEWEAAGRLCPDKITVHVDQEARSYAVKVALVRKVSVKRI